MSGCTQPTIGNIEAENDVEGGGNSIIRDEYGNREAEPVKSSRSCIC